MAQLARIAGSCATKGAAMTHEEAFLLDILERPEDDTPRRVCADWLLDHHDPVRNARGEFIHLQLDLARLPPEAPRPTHLVARERELLAAHGREWGAGLMRLGCYCWQYRRGFVEAVGLPGAMLLVHGAAVFRAGPVSELKLYGVGRLVRDVAASPLLARVRVLDFESNHFGDEELDALAASPHLGELVTLMLWSNRVSDEGVAALARAEPPRLTRLDLSSNLVGDDGAKALAASPLLGRLALLDLTNNQVGDAGALALAASPHLDGLGWLDLSKNPIGPGAQTALRERMPGRVQVWG
jgi:uncharacterized protein (TIGR02996 family)